MVGIVIASLWATPVTAELRALLSPLTAAKSSNGANCDGCDCEADACCETSPLCMICRPHRTRRTVELQRWSVSTEPACVSWCKSFCGLGRGCSDCCAQAPNCRCSQVRPRNRLLRLKEARYVPTVVHLAESECQKCSCYGDVAGVQLQAAPKPDSATTATESAKIYWIDKAAEEAVPRLGVWTDPAKETKSDEINTAKVHWLNAPAATSPPAVETKPIHRVSDLPTPKVDLLSPVGKTEPDPNQDDQDDQDDQQTE